MTKIAKDYKPIEFQEIDELFNLLLKQTKCNFPKPTHTLNVTTDHGVYVIRKKEQVLHVGRSIRGKGGLHQRLMNHLHSSSSFITAYLNGDGEKLRDRTYTYQYLEVPDSRKRALLEAYAIGRLCPEHVGLGVER